MGIADAVAEGMPEDYVANVMRKFIPEGKKDGGDEAVIRLARNQAKEFVDED